MDRLRKPAGKSVPRTSRIRRVKRPTEAAHDDPRAEALGREIGRRAIVSIYGQDVNHLDVRERDGDETHTVEDEPERGAA